MSTTSNGLLASPNAKHAATYLLKAAAVVGVLYLFARTAVHLPSAVVALVWAALSAFVALGVSYRFLMFKLRNRVELDSQGGVAKITRGHILLLIFAFAVAAVFVASMLLDVPTWAAPEWAAAAAAVPLYLLVSLPVQRWAAGQFVEPYRTARTASIAAGLTCVLLCVVFAIVLFAQQPPGFQNTAEAFQAASVPYQGFVTGILSEVGKYLALTDGLSSFALAKAGEASFGIYIAVRLVLYVFTAIALAGLLGICWLPWARLGSVFRPLQELQEGGARAADPSAPSPRRTLLKPYLAVAVLLPVLLVAGFGVADARVAQAVATQEYTEADRFVQDQLGMLAWVLDGKYYEEQAVRELLDQTSQKAQELSDEAQANLVPKINQAYDACLAKVDEYLDWYYSLRADYERLGQTMLGAAEEFTEREFRERVESGLDEAGLDEALADYVQRAEALQSEFEEQLAACEIKGVPEKLLKVEREASVELLDQPLQPTQQLLSAPARLGVSTAAGLGAGILAKRLVQKAIQKQFFSKMVSKVGTMVASRAAGGAAGGAIGSLGGPLGTIAGVAIGTGVAIATDQLTLMADEAMNRETYKQEIVDSIEQQRAETLALVQ